MMWDIVIGVIVSCATFSNVASVRRPWSWSCDGKHCLKQSIQSDGFFNSSTIQSLAICNLLCLEKGGIWPIPTGSVYVSDQLYVINPERIAVKVKPQNASKVAELKDMQLTASVLQTQFKQHVRQLVDTNNWYLGRNAISQSNARPLLVHMILEDMSYVGLTLFTNESYEIDMPDNFDSADGDDTITVTIRAATFFGGRHGLETLGQLIVYDDLFDNIKMPSVIRVKDAPRYPYRGILLDTSRNFVSVDAIKRQLVAMGASKMNRFHWHITDSHSWPLWLRSAPELSEMGAYSRHEVYTPKDIAEVVEFARQRGVAVVPEFDAPAHVGEGWQNTSFLVCFNAQPWTDFCVEPPCGQLDPTKATLYNYIEKIYGEMNEYFRPDIFHMGGDEVDFRCWKSVPHISEWMVKEKQWGTTDSDYIKLWAYFQNNALNKLDNAVGHKLPVIMWTSHLTKDDYLKQYLPNDRYIIQIWTHGKDSTIQHLLKNGYQVILSNYDALYFDCGFGGWVADGQNWCSPYIGWHKVYENKPALLAGAFKKQILGSEATLWTEQADSYTVDSRIWPRAAALAEILWSEPSSSWHTAEQRLLVHRRRLVEKGVAADRLEPEWCHQNGNQCPAKKV